MSNEPEAKAAAMLRPLAFVERISFLSGERFSLKEQIFFAKRLSFLVKAGVPILECLSVIRSQTKSKGKIRVYDTVISDIANGQYLATSLGKFRHSFNELTVNLIRIGESSGVLTQNLAYLADELQKKSALKRKVIGALVYPVFITIMTLGITGMLTIFIFPKIMPIFVSLHVPLPLTTRILIGVSAYLRMWGLLTIAVIIALVIIYLVIRAKNERVRFRSDQLLLSLPLAGPIARSYNLANFTRTLGLMLQSGIPVASALVLAAETTPNRTYRYAYERLAESITKGETISRGLTAEGRLFPDILTHMIAVGETTGNLSTTLLYLADLYEEEVEELTKNLSSSIEPVLMIIMGLLVGLIAVSVITPIYEITQHLNPHGG